MDLTVKDCLEDLPSSQFPGAPRRHVKDHHYESFCISIHEEFYSAFGECHETLEELVQAAWALLLRSYLQDDTISFAVLLGEQSGSIFKKQARTGALVVQYQLPEACRLKDIRAARCWKTTREVMKMSKINTAINLLASLSEPMNGELAKLTAAQHNLDNTVSFFFIVTSFLDDRVRTRFSTFPI